MNEWLYVMEFDLPTPVIKVGRAIDPDRRMAQHADRGSVFGVAVGRSHKVECSGSAAQAEDWLIASCVDAAQERRSLEWFVGLSFEQVVAQANAAASGAVVGFMNPLDEAIRAAGGLTVVARALDRSPQSLFNWIARGSVPVEYAAELERALGMGLRRWDMRPADWHRIWPELIGADGAPPVPAEQEAA